MEGYFLNSCIETSFFFRIRNSLSVGFLTLTRFISLFLGCFCCLLRLRGLAPLHCGPLPKRDCDFAPWGEWGECSASCDGGMRERSRHIKTPNSNDGVPGVEVGVGRRVVTSWGVQLGDEVV